MSCIIEHMPHVRPRQVQHLVEKSLKLSPIVGILGHRQVGKTTLLEQIATHYRVLDTKAAQTEISSNPAQFLAIHSGSLTALDECQHAPALFPELKEWVRTHKKPGQFLLSGSVRFTSGDMIKESLTGRIMTHELLPMTISELEGRPLPSFLLRLQSTQNFLTLKESPELNQPIPVSRKKNVFEYFEKGGLPGVCFIRDPKQRLQKIEQQLLTILDRDIRLVKRMQVSFGDIRSLVSILANMQGRRLTLTDIQTATGLAVPTLKKLIYCLEAVYVLRSIRSTGTTNGHTLFFEDMAEAHFMRSEALTRVEELVHFCFTQFRALFQYRLGEPYQVFQFATRGGAFVPLCFQNKSGVLGVIAIEHPDEIPRHSGTVRSFLSRYSNARIVFVYTADEKPKVLTDRILAVHIAALV